MEPRPDTSASLAGPPPARHFGRGSIITPVGAFPPGCRRLPSGPASPTLAAPGTGGGTPTPPPVVLHTPPIGARTV